MVTECLRIKKMFSWWNSENVSCNLFIKYNMPNKWLIRSFRGRTSRFMLSFGLSAWIVQHKTWKWLEIWMQYRNDAQWRGRVECVDIWKWAPAMRSILREIWKNSLLVFRMAQSELIANTHNVLRTEFRIHIFSTICYRERHINLHIVLNICIIFSFWALNKLIVDFVDLFLPVRIILSRFVYPFELNQRP